jgi:hypothetical protein
MRPLNSGRGPLGVARITAALALIATVSLGGCAGTHSEGQSWNGGSYAVAGGSAPLPRTATEEDGLPSQVPPLRRDRSEPDDPSEPFSPNYGPRRPTLPVRQAWAKPPIPPDLPPLFRPRLASAPVE